MLSWQSKSRQGKHQGVLFGSAHGGVVVWVVVLPPPAALPVPFVPLVPLVPLRDGLSVAFIPGKAVGIMGATVDGATVDGANLAFLLRKIIIFPATDGSKTL